MSDSTNAPATAPAQKVNKTEAEWRELLTPEQFQIMRQKGTERPFTGALVDNHDDGIYHCAACNAPLFTSDKKFESGSGWPSFWLPVSADAIEAHEDSTLGMRRVESISNFNRQRQSQFSFHRLPGNLVLQRHAIQKLHGDEGAPAVFGNLVDGADVGVV